MFKLGSEAGVCMEVDNEKALDIPSLTYKGVNIGYQPPLGMLMTCGLENIGRAGEWDGYEYPHHGSIRHEAAKSVTTGLSEDGREWVEGIIEIELEDGSHYSMNRRITCTENQVTVEDTVKNLSDQPQAVYIMYHYNFGRPFLDEKLELNPNALDSKPRSEAAEKDIDNMLNVTPPVDNFEGQVFNHFYDAGQQHIRAYNPTNGITVEIGFDGSTLPFINHWKQLSTDQYVVAMEPCNSIPLGKVGTMEAKTAKYLDAGESITYRTWLKFNQL